MVREAWALQGQRLDALEMYQLQRSLVLGAESQCMEPVHGPRRNKASFPRVDKSDSLCCSSWYRQNSTDAGQPRKSPAHSLSPARAVT